MIFVCVYYDTRKGNRRWWRKFHETRKIPLSRHIAFDVLWPLHFVSCEQHKMAFIKGMGRGWVTRRYFSCMKKLQKNFNTGVKSSWNFSVVQYPGIFRKIFFQVNHPLGNYFRWEKWFYKVVGILLENFSWIFLISFKYKF